MLATLALTAALFQGADARLSAKVTLSENIASLKSLCDDLQKQTHVPFVADKLVRDRKIALFVENRSASEVLNVIEKALFLKFEPDHEGYRLVLPDKIRVEEREIVDDEKAAYRDGIETILRRLSGLATKSMHDLDMEYDDLMDRMRRLARQADPKSQGQLAAALDRLREMDGYHGTGVAAALVKQIPAVAASLMDGQTIVVTSDSKLGPYVIDPQLAPTIPGDKGTWQAPAAAYATLKYVPMLGSLRILILDYQDLNSTGKQNYVDVSIPRKIDWSKERFYKRLAESGDSPDQNVMGMALPEPPKAPPSEYRGRAYSLADHLKYLSKVTGIPMVADAFRLAISGERYFSSKTLAAYLAKLSEPQMGPMARVGYVHAENGWLIFRHYDTWMLQVAEVPEDLITPLEAKSQGDGIPTIDDYAKFADQLDNDQMQAFQTATPILMRCPRLPLYCMMPLRLWGRLSKSEQNSAAKDTLTLDQLSLADANLFRFCVLESMDSAGVTLAEIRAVLLGDPALRFGCFDIGGNEGFHMLDMEEIGFGVGGSNPAMVDRASQVMFTYKLQNDLLGMDICTVLHKPPARL